MKEQQIPVAKEGYPFIVFAFLVTLVLALLEFEIAALIGLVISGLVLNFFRDPDRIIPDEPNTMVSPADGKVILISKVFDDKFINDNVCKVSIFMNVFNVHVNRVPFAGEVQEIKYAPGKFYSADSNRAALENEYCGVILETAEKQKIAFVQMAGLIARRIVCWAEKGDVLQKGERFGLIRFGSRVDLYLPVDIDLKVEVGQNVVAGESVIGHMT